MASLHVQDGDDATIVSFNDASLVSDETVDYLQSELIAATFLSSSHGRLVLDFEGVEWISLGMVRCLLSLIKVARMISVNVSVRNIAYRITDESMDGGV